MKEYVLPPMEHFTEEELQNIDYDKIIEMTNCFGYDDICEDDDDIIKDEIKRDFLTRQVF